MNLYNDIIKIHREGIVTRWIFGSKNEQKLTKVVDNVERLWYYDKVAAKVSNKLHLDK